MQTGKFLGIGAALSAGLLAANVASASVVTGIEVESGISGLISASAYTGGGVLYVDSSGSYGVSTATGAPSGSTTLFSWAALNISAVSSGQSSLSFSVVDLRNPGYTLNEYDAIQFYASGTGFTYLNSGTNALTTSGSATYSGASTSDVFSQNGFAGSTNGAFDTSGDNTGQQNAAISQSSGTATPATATTNVTDLTTTGYSLTYLAQFTQSESTSSFGTAASPAGGSVSIPGTAAVSLPGSGPLTIVGGLVVVGGLAIRRRMKA